MLRSPRSTSLLTDFKRFGPTPSEQDLILKAWNVNSESNSWLSGALSAALHSQEQDQEAHHELGDIFGEARTVTSGNSSTPLDPTQLNSSHISVESSPSASDTSEEFHTPEISQDDVLNEELEYATHMFIQVRIYSAHIDYSYTFVI